MAQKKKHSQTEEKPEHRATDDAATSVYEDRHERIYQYGQGRDILIEQSAQDVIEG